jgi:hypothetical protein
VSDLSFVKEKLKRADTHIQTADAVAKAHCESDFYGLKIEPYRKGGHCLRVTEVVPFPTDFSILVGEVAYQLRSSLDHIAFAFCAPKNRKEEKSVQFPFASRAREWKGTHANLLPGATKRAKALFERFQPYHRRKEPAVKYLWYINAVTNWEKHRAPATAAAGVRFSRGKVTFPDSCEVKSFKHFPARVIKSRAIVAKFQIAEGSPDADVDVHTETGFTPVFDKGMPNVALLGVLQTLEIARRFICNVVLPEFEKLP